MILYYKKIIAMPLEVCDPIFREFIYDWLQCIFISLMASEQLFIRSSVKERKIKYYESTVIFVNNNNNKWIDV